MEHNTKSIVGNSIGTMNGNMIVGDTNNQIYQIEKIENISNIDGNGNITLQGITNSNVTINITVSEELFNKNYEIIRSVKADTETLLKIQQLQTEILKRIEAKLDGKYKKPNFLTNQPFIPPVFEGRAEELTQVHDKLFAGQNFIMLVNGVGGIGKTSFAAKYWERYQAEYNYLAFLYVENTITDALLSLEMELKLELPPEMPANERVSQIMAAVSKLQKPCLLVLDNVNNKQDLTDHIYLLRQCPNFHILLTSRLADFDYAQKHKINQLDEETALQVFKQHYKSFDDEDVAHFKKLYTAVDGNTLVLELFAKNLNYFNNHLNKKYPLQQLIADIEQGLTRLSKSTNVETEYQAKGTGLRNETPQAIILSMYELNHLTDTDKQLLSVLSVLPAENIAFKTIETLLQGTDTENLDQHLLSLTQQGWVEFNPTEKTFKISPVIQEVVRHRNADQIHSDTEILVNNLNEQLESDGVFSLTRHTIESAAGFARYAESVFAALRHKPTFSLSMLSERIATYYKAAGNFDQALQFFHLATDLFKELYEANPKSENLKNGLAISYERLGDIYQSLGDFDQALQFFHFYNQYSKELYEANPKSENLKRGLAISYEKLGSIYQSLGDFDQALQFFHFYNQYSKELYEANPKSENLKNGLAISYGKLGDIYQSLGDFDQALQFFHFYNQYSKELYEANPKSENLKRGLAISYEKLGSIYQSLGDFDQALQFFHLVTDLFKELYEANPKSENLKNGLAISYEKLGDIYQSLGDFDQALQFFHLRNQLSKELYEANPKSENLKNGLAISYGKLGDIYQSLGDFDQALQFFHFYNQYSKELYEANPKSENLKNGLAISYEKLGDIYQSLGDFDQALQFFNLDIEISKELYEANPKSENLKNGLAISYERLGDIYQSLGDFDQALQFFHFYNQYSKELYEANPKSENLKNGLAISYSKLGDIYQSLGDFDQALQFFHLVTDLFKELYEANPKSENLKRGLAISYERLGDIYQKMGDFDQALQFFNLDIEISKELYEANPKNVGLLEGLAISFYKLAMVYKAKGDDKNGKQAFAEWKQRIEFLAQNVPQVSKYQKWNKVEY